MKSRAKALRLRPPLNILAAAARRLEAYTEAAVPKCRAKQVPPCDEACAKEAQTRYLKFKLGLIWQKSD